MSFSRTRIEWTETTWNPVTGCSPLSAGCERCYARRFAPRLRSMGLPEYADGFEVRCHPHRLLLPFGWGQPRMVFVNSMSDIFHDEVPLSFLRQVWASMEGCFWHRFQVLTKRAETLANTWRSLSWPKNVWLGVTVEHQATAWRVSRLRQVPAAVRFVSCEPLLSPVELELEGIDWVIAGGESGPGARPCHPDWVRDLRDRCAAAGVRFFFKRWGGPRPKSAGRVLDGRTHDELPDWYALPRA